MNKGLVTIFICVAIYAIFMTALMAYAEETADTVLIPFEPNSRICGYTDDEKWVCEWYRAVIDLGEVFTNNTSTVHEPIEAQTKAEEEPEETPAVNLPMIAEKPTKFEQDLQRFIDDPPISAADKEYFELLKNLAQCQRGYAESRGIQTNGWFDISFTWINEDEAWIKALDYTGRHGELKKAIEECQAIRTVMNPVQLGPEAYNKGQYFGKHQPHHNEMTTITSDESKFVASFAVYDKITDRDVSKSQDEAKEAMCNLATSFRLDYCKNPVHVDVGGVVSIQNSPEDKWLQYQKDGGVAMAKEIKAKALAEQIARIYGGQK